MGGGSGRRRRPRPSRSISRYGNFDDFINDLLGRFGGQAGSRLLRCARTASASRGLSREEGSPLASVGPRDATYAGQPGCRSHDQTSGFAEGASYGCERASDEVNEDGVAGAAYLRGEKRLAPPAALRPRATSSPAPAAVVSSTSILRLVRTIRSGSSMATSLNAPKAALSPSMSVRPRRRGGALRQPGCARPPFHGCPGGGVGPGRSLGLKGKGWPRQ